MGLVLALRKKYRGTSWGRGARIAPLGGSPAFSTPSLAQLSQGSPYRKLFGPFYQEGFIIPVPDPSSGIGSYRHQNTTCALFEHFSFLIAALGHLGRVAKKKHDKGRGSKNAHRLPYPMQNVFLNHENAFTSFNLLPAHRAHAYGQQGAVTAYTHVVAGPVNSFLWFLKTNNAQPAFKIFDPVHCIWVHAGCIRSLYMLACGTAIIVQPQSG